MGMIKVIGMGKKIMTMVKLVMAFMKAIKVMMLMVMMIEVLMENIDDQIKIAALCLNCDVQVPNKRFSIILDNNHNISMNKIMIIHNP